MQIYCIFWDCICRNWYFPTGETVHKNLDTKFVFLTNFFYNRVIGLFGLFYKNVSTFTPAGETVNKNLDTKFVIVQGFFF